MRVCPKCGFEQATDATDCSRCGIVFSRYEAARVHHTEALFESTEKLPVIRRQSAAALPTVASRFLPHVLEVEDAEDGATDGRFGPGEIGILAFGLIGALLFVSVPLLQMLIWPIKTLFHELGHTLTGWLLGHPSIPAFDFMFGGGLTHYGAFQPLLAIVIAGGFAWIGWRLRTNRTSLAMMIVIAAAWLIVVLSEWRSETVVASAGALFELIFAAIFLYMAIAGIGFRNAAVERPLAAFVAFVVQFMTMRFLWQLRSDDVFLAGYKEGKGGALMNDLEIVALNLHIHTPFHPSIQALAGMLLFYSFLPMTVAVLWFLNRRFCQRAVARLLQT